VQKTLKQMQANSKAEVSLIVSEEARQKIEPIARKVAAEIAHHEVERIATKEARSVAKKEFAKRVKKYDIDEEKVRKSAQQAFRTIIRKIANEKVGPMSKIVAE